MKPNKLNVVSFLSLITALMVTSSQATLIVDFHGNDDPGPTTATAADFAVNDSLINAATAVVNTFDGDVNNAGTQVAITGTETLAGATITAEQLVGSGFNPTGGPFVGDPILGDYLFGSNVDPEVVIDGLNIVAGQTVNLVVYSHGDQTAQVADVVLDIDNDGVDDFTSAVTSVAQPFQTFNFVAGSDISTFSFRADNAGEGNQFAALNGFSLTVIPEPTSIALLSSLLALACMGIRRRRAV